MEQIISNLLLTNNETRNEATAAMMAALRTKDGVRALVEVLFSKAPEDIRQYASVLLRNHLGKQSHWEAFVNEDQKQLQRLLTAALLKEPNSTIRKNIAQVAASLLQHENVTDSPWVNDIWQVVATLCTSLEEAEKEMGARIFSIFTDRSPHYFIKYLSPLSEILLGSLTISDAEGTLMAPRNVFMITSLSNLFLCDSEESHHSEHVVNEMLPLIFKLLHQLSSEQGGGEQFGYAFEIVETLSDHTNILMPTYAHPVIDFCMKVARDTTVENSIRNRVVAFMRLVVLRKRKLILQLKLWEPILNVAFHIMATETANPNDIVDCDMSGVAGTAYQLVDVLTESVPTKRVVPVMFSMMEKALSYKEAMPRRAAYLCMASLADGCSNTIRNDYMKPFVNVVKKGITDGNSLVRNAAMYAVEQFAEFLQPEFCQYANDILPKLLQIMRHYITESQASCSETSDMKAMFDALYIYCESMKEQLVPYLPMIMEQIFEAFQPNHPFNLREMTLRLLHVTVVAVKSEIIPYFDPVLTLLNGYVKQSNDEMVSRLRFAAVDTLASLIVAVGDDKFRPLANHALILANELIYMKDDGDLRCVGYNLLSAITETIKDDMPVISAELIKRIFRTIVIHKSTNNLCGLGICGDGHHGACTNTDSEEKQEAIRVLKNFALYIKNDFSPYIRDAFRVVFKSLSYCNEDVLSNGMEALVTFVIFLFERQDMDGVRNAVFMFVPKLCRVIEKDVNPQMVTKALESLDELLTDIGKRAVPTPELREQVFHSGELVLTHKTHCQSDEVFDRENPDIDCIKEVVESTLSVLLEFFDFLKPHDFAAYFKRLAPILIQHLRTRAEEDEDEDDDNTDLDVQIYHLIADYFKAVTDHRSQYTNQLVQILLNGMTHVSEDVRAYAYFGLGDYTYNASDLSKDDFLIILNNFMSHLFTETDDTALDGVCGAIARLILKQPSFVPMPETAARLLNKLPLRDNTDEYGVIFRSLDLVLNCFDRKLVEQTIVLVYEVLDNNELEDRKILCQTLALAAKLRTSYPEVFESVAIKNRHVTTVARMMDNDEIGTSDGSD